MNLIGGAYASAPYGEGGKAWLRRGNIQREGKPTECPTPIFSLNEGTVGPRNIAENKVLFNTDENLKHLIIFIESVLNMTKTFLKF